MISGQQIFLHQIGGLSSKLCVRVFVCLCVRVCVCVYISVKDVTVTHLPFHPQALTHIEGEIDIYINIHQYGCVCNLGSINVRKHKCVPQQ